MPKPLTEWSHWRTEREEPLASDALGLHKCCRVTVHKLFEHDGKSMVQYSYCDYTTRGAFTGRDTDSEEDFRRMFPVREA